MATRDLTSTFLERRSTANMRRRGGSGGGSGGGKQHGQSPKLTAGGGDSHFLMEEGDIQMSSLGDPGVSSSSSALPPQWVDDVDGVHSVLSDITRSMEVLKGMHASRIGSVFGKDLDDMEGKIERLTHEITNQFRTAERFLKKVGLATNRAGGEEATIGANVQRSLAKQLQELSVEFRQDQRMYLADVQAQKSGGMTSQDDKFGIMNGSTTNGAGDNDDFMTMQQVTMVDDLSDIVQGRDTEIAKIAQSIEELGTIFKELAVLVIDQGTILDRIDYNMEAVVEHTKTGISQLERGGKKSKKCTSYEMYFLFVSYDWYLVNLIGIETSTKALLFVVSWSKVLLERGEIVNGGWTRDWSWLVKWLIDLIWTSKSA
eukprot:CAMPEP_0195292598 /NCGR_PEP_ID=MMETSP0707-20130614/10223_1 /TAXON_ID=33640 /ORGANISM="Asterionellopsis glacialis, Strain CCMP134" /LENGTH=372 /DNA_ID=CAMNT_0040353099 /DNA_START=60 /DNA_END=1174 /DNA_ORIENTATION=-